MADIPAQKTKKYLESLGWHGDYCNRWLMGANVRKDFMGLADLGFVRHDFSGTWFVNACYTKDVRKHIKDYLNGGIRESGKRKGESFPPNPHLPVLLCGNRFSVFGWGQYAKREEDGSFMKRKDGKRMIRREWEMVIVDFYLSGTEVKFKESEGESGLPQLP